MLLPNSGFCKHTSMVSFAIWFGLLMPLVAGQGADSPCSSNSLRCLQVLRNYLTRTDWWFGDSYSTICPGDASDKTFPCMNVDKQHKSIISRIFQGDSFDVNNITQLLRVRFYVPAGSYRACGRIFNVPSVSMDQDLDFSQRTGLDSWSLQKRPAITWDAIPGVLYTLVAYNVDLLQLAGLWVNIKGGDSALGYEIYPYNGPMYALNRTSFHAFLLLKQSAVVEDRQFNSLLTEIQSAIESNNGVYRLNNLSSPVGQIKDLVGVGLISVGADPYGIEVHKSSNIYNNCPWLLARMRPTAATVVAVQGLAALGADVSNLETEVEVSYRSEAIDYTSCCRSVSVSKRTLSIDPISMSPGNPVYVRSQPFIRLSAVDMMNHNFFFGKMFTLVFLDVTPATMSSPSKKTSLQWLVVDSAGQYPTTGVSLKEYVIPLPPVDRNGSSLYMFFVFTQNNSLRNASWSNYCSNTNTSADCDFTVDKFAKDNQLRLSGLSFFYSQPDMYSRMKLYENNTSRMDAACRGVSGYGRPCPDPCVTTTKPVVTTAASGNKSNGVPATITAWDRGLLLLLLVSSLIVTMWRIS